MVSLLVNAVVLVLSGAGSTAPEVSEPDAEQGSVSDSTSETSPPSDATPDTSGPWASQEPGTESPTGATPTPDLVAKANQRWEAGDLAGALALVDDAVLADPEFGPLYLMRAQLQAEIAESKTGQERSSLLTAAAADLDRYLAKSEDDATDAQLLEDRNALLAAAEAARREGSPEDVEPDPEPGPAEPLEPEPEPVVSVEPAQTRPTDRRISPVAPILFSGAAMFTVTGAALGATSLVVEQRCGPPCDADVVIRTARMSVAGVGSGVGAALAGWGMARLSPELSDKTRRRVAIATGAAAGVFAVATAVTAGIAGQRWGAASPSSPTDLSGVQQLANSSVVTGTFVAPLLTAAIVAAIPPRKRRGVARR